jgi:hypothetical protein
MRFPSGLVLLTLLAPLILAQQPQSQPQPQPRQYAPRDGGVSEVLQSIYIPPLVNAPFTAIVHTEWAKPIGDGVNLLSIVNDPRIGKQTFTLTDVILGDPDPKLFELPEGHGVVDHRQSAE